MSHRFYFPTLAQYQNGSPADPDQVLMLSGDQAKHASQVMRFKVGDSLVLFDGLGLEADCEILSTSKKSLELSPRNFHQRPRAFANSVSLAVALPKGDRQKVLVEKLVELGVTRLIPLKTRRGVADFNDKVKKRLEKQVVEASKQCERAWLMTIEPACDLNRLAQRENSEASGEPPLLLLADPYEGHSSRDLIANTADQDVVIAIGPEGGFEANEIDQAVECGYQRIRLGQTILRIETAAIAAAVIFGMVRGSEPESRSH